METDRLSPWLVAAGVPFRFIAMLALSVFFIFLFMIVSVTDPHDLEDAVRSYCRGWRWVFTP